MESSNSSLSPEPIEHKWAPIALPTAEDIGYASPAAQQLDALVTAWDAQKVTLEHASPEGLKEFLNKLVRSWAIETGILERLYDLDEGATKTLIEHGFRADLVERGASRIEPEQLITVLQDHQTAAEMVLDLVSEDRPLTVFFVRELHQLLTRNQLTTEAITPTGEVIEVPMEHGKFKTLPNNPMRSDGSVHEYAPPEHVGAEMERLISGYGALDDASLPVTAAWLHHRFSQIHPFQDGNGRVARALTNYVFVKGGLFPLVVSREDRVKYLTNLETADQGRLGPLIDLFAQLQSQTVLDALAVARDEDRITSVALNSVVETLANRFGRRIHDRQSVLRGVNDVARELRDRGERHLSEKTGEAVAQFNEVGMALTALHGHGGLGDGSEHYWKFQVIHTANELGYWVNLAEGQYWIRITINWAPVGFRYVVSLHHTGHELNGVMRASAFVEFDAPSDRTAAGDEAALPSDRERQNCTPTLFTFTWQSDVEQLWPSFRTWLDESLAMALRRWMDLF